MTHQRCARNGFVASRQRILIVAGVVALIRRSLLVAALLIVIGAFVGGLNVF